MTFIDEIAHYFNDVPVSVYVNNDELYGDFERVKGLIDAYDKTQSDTANDFEYFTNALLVVSGILMNDDENESPLDFKNNRVLNFANTDSKAEYLIKSAKYGNISSIIDGVSSLKNRLISTLEENTDKDTEQSERIVDIEKE